MEEKKQVFHFGPRIPSHAYMNPPDPPCFCGIWKGLTWTCPGPWGLGLSVAHAASIWPFSWERKSERAEAQPDLKGWATQRGREKGRNLISKTSCLPSRACVWISEEKRELKLLVLTSGLQRSGRKWRTMVGAVEGRGGVHYSLFSKLLVYSNLISLNLAPPHPYLEPRHTRVPRTLYWSL